MSPVSHCETCCYGHELDVRLHIAAGRHALGGADCCRFAIAFSFHRRPSDDASAGRSMPRSRSCVNRRCRRQAIVIRSSSAQACRVLQTPPAHARRHVLELALDRPDVPGQRPLLCVSEPKTATSNQSMASAMATQSAQGPKEPRGRAE
jgi:hypothetical protein